MVMQHANTVYEELRGWQAGIGSVVGFLALMAAALWNFRLNRRRDEALRREEMLSVAAALYGEILLLRDEAALLARLVAAREIQGAKFDEEFVRQRKFSEPILYPALAPKIGLLPPDLIVAITAFHKNWRKAKEYLPFLVEDETRPYSYGPTWVLEPAVAAVEDIRPALRKVETLANIPVADDPDLGDAEALLENERELAAEYGKRN